MAGGGAERTVLRLATYFVQIGKDVDIVLLKFAGPLLREIPNSINLVVLDPDYLSCKHRVECSIPTDQISWIHNSEKISFCDFLRLTVPNWPLGVKVIPRRRNRYVVFSCSFAQYLRDFRPEIVIAIMANSYFVSIMGVIIARLPIPTVCSIRAVVKPDKQEYYQKRAYDIYSKLLRKSDWVHTISEGIKIDLVAYGLCSRDRISTIYNPINSSDLQILAKQPALHEWIKHKKRNSYKVILSVASLSEIKNHKLLLNAFSKVVEKTHAKLIILGDGPERSRLEHQIVQLKLTEHVSMPGWIRNPYAYMSQCDVFVLSSNYEGLGNVIIEALQLGCNIVSTDCPHGPREILVGGRFGTLVSVDDKDGLANAILDAINIAPNRQVLRSRAAEFTLDYIGPQFVDLFDRVNCKPC